MINELIIFLYDKKFFFIELVLQHLKISITSLFISIVFGLFVGVMISEFRKSSKFILNIVSFIYTVPSISLLGILIPFSGIGDKTAIIALSVYALLPMVRSTYTGLININPLLLEAAVGMGSTRWQTLFKIKIPLALPFIVSGIRNMSVMTISLAGIASFIGAGGLGVAIYRGITTNNKLMTIAGSLLIAFLAFFIDLMIEFFEKKTRKYER